MYFGTRPYLHEELYCLFESRERLFGLLHGQELVHASLAIPKFFPNQPFKDIQQPLVRVAGRAYPSHP